MEKKAFTVRNAMVILCAAVVIIGMFLNWYLVEIDLGVLQLNDLIGKINAFTLPRMVFEIEDRLGVLAELLPDGFEMLKAWSVILSVLGAVTVAMFTSAIVFNLLRKNKYIDLLSFGAATGAIATVIIFSRVVMEVYSVTGAAAAGYNALSILMKTPWLIVLLGGAVTILCTEVVGSAFLGCIISLAEAVKRLIAYIVEWIKVVAENILFVLSDVAGAVAGVWFGTTVYSMCENAFVGVIAGLTAAGVLAAVCCFVAAKILGKKY